jgi:spore germination protein KB
MVALLALSRIEAATVFLPVVSASRTLPDTWIGASAGPLLAALPLALLGWLSLRHDGECLVGMARRNLGRAGAAALGAFLAVFFLLCAACTIRHVVEVYTGVIMPETPGLVFAVALVLVACYATLGEATVLGRSAVMVCAFAIPLLVLTLALPINQMRAHHLLPAFQVSLSEVAQTGSISFAFSMQAIAGAMLFPYLKPSGPRQMAGLLLVYTLLSTAVMAASTLAVVAVYGATASGLSFPVLSLARRVAIADLIERVEMLPVVVWTGAAAARVALFVWASAASLTRAFGVTDRRPLILPLGYLCVVVSMFIVQNTFQMLRFYRWDVWGLYGTVVQVGVIALLAAAYFARLAATGSRQRAGRGRA